MRGPVGRDVIATTTSLSIATVNRQVIALLDAGLLWERADLAVSGAIGRPRVPVEVNHEPFVTLGLHIGARTTSIVATDLLGRTLDTVETATPRSSASSALASLADSAGRYLRRWHRRRALWVGSRSVARWMTPAATSTTNDSAGGTHRWGPRWQTPWGFRSRWHPTSTRWPEPNFCSVPGASRGVIDQPVCLRSRNRGLRAGDRRAGALSGQRPGHDRGFAGPLRTARRYRPARVDGERRGGAGRCPPSAHHRGHSAGPYERLDHRDDRLVARGAGGKSTSQGAARGAGSSARRDGCVAARRAQPR
ncbi:hypothetical protein I551_7424 [Mycobacterium ulcerans str. Harvey]|uniref:ROK family protein n=1 Tax=Mycobacterium ulcerans str. Harvey TaxID=1299332 RepID=A0ABP3A8W7_MYCUL|nr:hypothetical protein I551_7424 [Mycobacterium ulcerans str. Harvey]